MLSFDFNVGTNLVSTKRSKIVTYLIILFPYIIYVLYFTLVTSRITLYILIYYYRFRPLLNNKVLYLLCYSIITPTS